MRIALIITLLLIVALLTWVTVTGAGCLSCAGDMALEIVDEAGRGPYTI